MAPAYRFDFVNRDGSVDTFDIGESADDGAAALHARSAMLVSLTAVAVEVWRGDARLCRICRDSSQRYLRGDLGLGPRAFSRPEGGERRPSARAASA